MLRDEFILFDTLKNINLITFIMCLMVLILGCKGKWAAWMKNTWMSRKSLKVSCFFTFILIVLGIVMSTQTKEIKRVFSRQSQLKHQTMNAENVQGIPDSEAVNNQDKMDVVKAAYESYHATWQEALDGFLAKAQEEIQENETEDETQYDVKDLMNNIWTAVTSTFKGKKEPELANEEIMLFELDEKPDVFDESTQAEE